MSWLLRLILGPSIWAATFAAAYAAHGTACANGLPAGPPMLALWLAGLLLGAALLLWLPRGDDLARRLPRAGGWIGLGATLFTLAPLLVLAPC